MLSTQLAGISSSSITIGAKHWRAYKIDRAEALCAAMYSQDLKLLQSEMVRILGFLAAFSIALISSSFSLISFHGRGSSSLRLLMLEGDG